ncbi:START domain-containing protein [Thalassotalea crassostreae]|uniref:START domain-containing protein n=1 Tax=Thalassotalea crassostreae TaxID=1763536 RepID=UPI0008380469|nr:START domain-containing protein [Thalassotalea crassostreae]
MKLFNLSFVSMSKKQFKAVKIVIIFTAFVLSYNAQANNQSNDQSSTSTIAADNPWQLQHSEDNIKLYHRALNSSEYLQTKAEVLVNFSATKLLEQFPINGECWQWQSRCKKSKKVKDLSGSDRLVYTVINMPWPVSDRDFVFHSSINFDEDSKTTTLILKPYKEQYPETKYVRGEANIRYEIRELTETTSHLTIIMHTDFKGSISASAINSKLISELNGNIKRLLRLLNE